MMDMVTILKERLPECDVFPYGIEWPETCPDPDQSIACIRVPVEAEVIRVYYSEEDEKYILDADYNQMQNFGPIEKTHTLGKMVHLIKLYFTNE